VCEREREREREKEKEREREVPCVSNAAQKASISKFNPSNPPASKCCNVAETQ
jgi:hypothetical protein